MNRHGQDGAGVFWTIAGIVLALVVATCLIIWLGTRDKSAEGKIVDLKNTASDQMDAAKAKSATPALLPRAASPLRRASITTFK